MALFDFLKRKKEIQKTKESSSAKASEDKKQPEKKADKVLDTPVVKRPAFTTGQAKKVKSFSYNIVKEPHISEKSTYLGDKNKYVFRVYDNSNKPEIKKAVEGIYGVDVLAVNVIKIPKKKRKIGRAEGFKKGYTKAIVTVKEGQKIEIF